VSGTIHVAGDLVGERYEVLAYVGEGGMQEVYRAKDLLLSREIALKAPKNASAEKRFKRSAVVSARVNHVNVAKTLDYVSTPKRPYLIEEFVEGRDLGEILKSVYRVLDPHLVARVLHRLAKGVAASHHAGVVHRDLKPSNVMVVGGETFQEVKITDFGIAKMAEQEIDEAVKGGDASLTASKTALGAIPYMAPEAIKATGQAGMASDIWSIGAMAYEQLCGARPFGVGWMAIPDILKADPPKVPTFVREKTQFWSLGEPIFEIILSCLAKDPENRPVADQLVAKCEQLCYSLAEREFGTVKVYSKPSYGFITPLVGREVFFHNESIYGERRFEIGDTVWFARHAGGGADRAFPLLKLRSNK
jgi:eukaryotic-like serine/threonine-protein kinase